MGRLVNRVALVSGGAHGIGAAIARRFSEEGARVVIADVNGEVGEPLARDIGATFAVADVSDHAAVGRLVTSVVESHGGLDIVVSNAAIFRGGTVEGTTPQTWRDVMAVNLAPCYHLAHFAVPHLRKRPGASLVIISSVQAIRGFPEWAAYAASKGGLLGLMRQMAVDLAPHVRVNAISPGTIRSYPEQWTSDGEREWAARHLLQRLGEPDEVARAAVFLASDEASFITGHNLVVDGGLTVAGGGVSAT
jgi:NAD(P)-dependent dehydrogenase (short-subunit alcohol dehydrogenase family)